MKFFQEFKKFITRGNVLDMAVGVIVGGAFNTIVTTLNKQVLMPVVNWALSYISNGDGLFTLLPNSKIATEEDIVNGVATVLGPDGLSYTVLNFIDWSALFESIINFFFIALTLFIIIKTAATVSKKRAELEEKLRSLAKKDEEEVVEEVVEAEPVVVEVKPTTEELLSEIITILKEKKEIE